MQKEINKYRHKTTRKETTLDAGMQLF